MNVNININMSINMNMKILVVLLLTLACLRPVAAQYDFDAVERDRMAKGKVKTQTQWTHEYVDGKPPANGYKSQVTKYNARGNVTEVSNYDKQGKVISLHVYQYDNRENRVNFEQYDGNREKLQRSQRTVYDPKGNKTREYGFDGASPYSNTFQYDANGRITEIAYTVENALVEKRQFKYSGNKTEILGFDKSNVQTFKQENTYNDKGLLVMEVQTGNKGNVVHTLNLQYNNAGGVSEEVKKREGDQLDYQKLYEYDSANRPTKETTVNTDGTKFVSQEYQYSNIGDLVFEAWKKTARAQESSTRKTIYDAKGLYTDKDCYYASYKLYTLFKFTYEYF